MLFDNQEKELSEFREYTHSRGAKSLADLKHILDLSWLARKDYQIVNTPSLLDDAIEHIKSARIISVDTETTGLNIYNLPDSSPIKDHIVGMSISWKRDQGIYIPFRHARIKNLDMAYALKRLQPYLEGKSIITHNGLFDAKVFYDLGIRLNITQDTFLMYFNLDSTVGKGSKGLKAITHRLYGYDVIELSDIFGSEKDAGLFAYVDEKVCKAYACADSDHTFMVFEDTFWQLLPEQRKAYQLDVRVQNELVRSEYNGKGIDMNLLKVLDDINNKDILTLERLVYSYVGIFLSRKHGEVNWDSMYTFNISSTQELGYVLFDLMGYEIPNELKGKSRISVDKHTLKALGDKSTDEVDEIFEHLLPGDLKSALADSNLEMHAGDDILIAKKDLAKSNCKVAKLVQKYRKLVKLKNSFFAPLAENYMGGRYFSGIKMARAETGRLVDFIQTLDKGLKKLIVPIDSDDYLLDFDFAQIEARCMVGLSGMSELAEHLNDPEADYHREAGVLILGKPAEDITDAERKDLKSVNFGIPYSMTAYGILENRYGIGLSKEERETHLAEINEILDKWYNSMTPIRDMLNRYRDQALTPVHDSTLPQFLRGHKIGRIFNPVGRSRLFYLDNVSKQKASAIRRQAGNFPIQSFAREIFCTAFCDLDDAMKRYGLIDIKVPDDTRPLGYRFENKVKIMAYIHDECLMSVDSSVNPYFMYKLIQENCMKHIAGHPTYYCGINIISNWYEGKSSKYEAPVRYVTKMVSENPSVYRTPKTAEETRDEVLAGIREFSLSRVESELKAISPQTAERIYDLRIIVPRFKNYAIKPLVETHLQMHRKPQKGNNADFIKVSLETLIAYRGYAKNVFIDMDGRAYTFDISTYQANYDTALIKEGVADRENLEAFDEDFESIEDVVDEVSFTVYSKNIAMLTNLFGG